MADGASGRPRHVVVVGGGVSGLTAAHEVCKRASARALELRCTVLEARARPGGNVVSERRDGYLLDGGPDSWLSAKPQVTALARELGLGAQLVGTRPENRRVYVVHRGGLVPMPEGVMLGVPTRLAPLVRTPLLSWRAKLRMGFDLVLPRRDPAAPEESLGGFVARRLGREAVEVLAAPLLAGIYAGDVDKLSARATFPQLLAMEARSGSLVRAALAARRKAPPAADAGASMFTSLAGGVGALVEALAGALPAGALRLGERVRALHRLPAGDPRGRYAVALDGGEVLAADDVVLAAPAWACAALLADAAPDAARALEAIPYSSAATVFLAYRREQVPRALDATGFVVPRREGLRVLASTWVSSKWGARAPAGRCLLRVFVGGAGAAGEAMVARGDAELATVAREDLGRVMGLGAEPLFTRVFRFERASPQPEVGHAARVARIHAALAALPGVHVLGGAYGGIGMPDCVRLATETAASLVG